MKEYIVKNFALLSVPQFPSSWIINVHDYLPEIIIHITTNKYIYYFILVNQTCNSNYLWKVG